MLGRTGQCQVNARQTTKGCANVDRFMSLSKAERFGTAPSAEHQLLHLAAHKAHQAVPTDIDAVVCQLAFIHEAVDNDHLKRMRACKCMARVLWLGAGLCMCVCCQTCCAGG